MQDIEPFYNWRHIYVANEDEHSPFWGHANSEFQYSNTIYNYYIHPQWDSFGIISIAVEIEKIYEINFVEEEIFGITSMEKLIDILKSKGINGQ